MSRLPPPNKEIYYEQVWALVRQVPVGRVATYGQIAKLIPKPEVVSAEDYKMASAQWVGLAMAACPDDVPWQRVINSQGKIARVLKQGSKSNFCNRREFCFHTKSWICESINGWGQVSLISHRRVSYFRE